jgi:hypothetical protein
MLRTTFNVVASIALTDLPPQLLTYNVFLSAPKMQAPGREPT